MADQEALELERIRLQSLLGPAQAELNVAATEWGKESKKRKKEETAAERTVIQERWKKAKDNLKVIENQLRRLDKPGEAKKSSTRRAPTARTVTRGRREKLGQQSESTVVTQTGPAAAAPLVGGRDHDQHMTKSTGQQVTDAATAPLMGSYSRDQDVSAGQPVPVSTGASAVRYVPDQPTIIDRQECVTQPISVASKVIAAGIASVPAPTGSPPLERDQSLGPSKQKLPSQSPDPDHHVIQHQQESPITSVQSKVVVQDKSGNGEDQINDKTSVQTEEENEQSKASVNSMDIDEERLIAAWVSDSNSGVELFSPNEGLGIPDPTLKPDFQQQEDNTGPDIMEQYWMNAQAEAGHPADVFNLSDQSRQVWPPNQPLHMGPNEGQTPTSNVNYESAGAGTPSNVSMNTEQINSIVTGIDLNSAISAASDTAPQPTNVLRSSNNVDSTEEIQNEVELKTELETEKNGESTLPAGGNALGPTTVDPKLLNLSWKAQQTVKSPPTTSHFESLPPQNGQSPSIIPHLKPSSSGDPQPAVPSTVVPSSEPVPFMPDIVQPSGVLSNRVDVHPIDSDKPHPSEVAPVAPDVNGPNNDVHPVDSDKPHPSELVPVAPDVNGPKIKENGVHPVDSSDKPLGVNHPSELVSVNPDVNGPKIEDNGLNELMNPLEGLESKVLATIPKDVSDEINQLHSLIMTNMEAIAINEHALCSAKERTIQEIRNALQHIDQGHNLVRGMTKRLKELQTLIARVQTEVDEKELRKPLEKRKRDLKNLEKSLMKKLLQASASEVFSLQLRVKEVEKEIDFVDKSLKDLKITAKELPLAGQPVDDDGEDEDVFGSEEEERKVFSEYNAMGTEEKVKYAEAARKSIEKFLKSGNLSDFKPKFRKAIKMLQNFLPEESLRSKSVAVAIHTTIQANLVCRYHMRHQKRKEHDTCGMYLVEGVAYLPEYGSKRSPVVPPEGYMNCGCLIDDVLYDFFFWKTWTVSSTRKDLQGRTETMKSDVLKPRVRSFIIKLFKETTMLTTDDLYGQYNVAREIREANWRISSIQRLVEEWTKRTLIPVNLDIQYPNGMPKNEEDALGGVAAVVGC